MSPRPAGWTRLGLAALWVTVMFLAVCFVLLLLTTHQTTAPCWTC